MGYTTEFDGSLQISPPVSDELKNYINRFSHTRRMKRDNAIIKTMDSNWKDHCFQGNLGHEGEYYLIPETVPKNWCSEKELPWVKKNPDTTVTEQFGQIHDQSVINYNHPPTTQPGLWCQWIITDNQTLEWDLGEKFYAYVEWLKYLIDNFFKPNGHTLNGTIRWRGEDFSDVGVIIVEDNDVTTQLLM